MYICKRKLYVKPKQKSMNENSGEIILYQPDKNIRLEVRIQEETVWLTQAQMGQLFDCSTDNISLHLKNLYAEGEIEFKATSEEISVVRQEGKRQVVRSILHYNLDAILSVGYRVSPFPRSLPHHRPNRLPPWCLRERPRQEALCLQPNGNSS